MKFSKMNGIGNDYIYVNLMEEKVENPSIMAKKLSNRHFSIGADGLVLIDKSDVADFSMRMFNADGSEGEMCGNAIRCVGKYVYERGLCRKTNLTISTLAGIKSLQLYIKDEKVKTVKVNMGKAFTAKEKIPIIYENDCENYILNKPIRTSKGDVFINCVSVGNPHTVVLVENDSQMDMALGEEISNHKVFPQRTNVEFVRIIDNENAFVRVYERGAGETLACGTGACASFYVCNTIKKLKNKAAIHLRGGKLIIEIIDDMIFMTGSAEFNYEGEVFYDIRGEEG